MIWWLLCYIIIYYILPFKGFKPFATVGLVWGIRHVMLMIRSSWRHPWGVWNVETGGEMGGTGWKVHNSTHLPKNQRLELHLKTSHVAVTEGLKEHHVRTTKNHPFFFLVQTFQGFTMRPSWQVNKQRPRPPVSASASGFGLGLGQAPSRAQKIPEDYLKKVKEMHELGTWQWGPKLFQRVKLIIFLIWNNMNQYMNQY